MYICFSKSLCVVKERICRFTKWQTHAVVLNEFLEIKKRRKRARIALDWKFQKLPAYKNKAKKLTEVQILIDLNL